MKLAVFLANGFEEVEGITVVDYLRRAGVEVTTVAVTTDSSLPNFVDGSHNIKIMADVAIDDYIGNHADDLPDAIYLPGGMLGATNLANSAQLLNFIKTCFDASRVVAAICAAPVVVLGKTGVLKNKKFTCYPGMEKELDSYAGDALLVDNSTYVGDSSLVTDGNLLTGAGPGSAGQVAIELIRMLCGEQTAQQIKNSTLQ